MIHICEQNASKGFTKFNWWENNIKNKNKSGIPVRTFLWDTVYLQSTQANNGWSFEYAYKQYPTYQNLISNVVFSSIRELEFHGVPVRGRTRRRVGRPAPSTKNFTPEFYVTHGRLRQLWGTGVTGPGPAASYAPDSSLFSVQRSLRPNPVRTGQAQKQRQYMDTRAGLKYSYGKYRTKSYKKLSYCWETVRRESMPRIAEMDVEMTT